MPQPASAPTTVSQSAGDVVLRPAGAPRLAPRAFAGLVLHLTRRQLASTHALTLLGWAWPVARQLVQLAVLVFLFSSVFDLGIPNFPVFVYIGLLAWSWFSGGVSAGATSLLSQRHLVAQPRLPNAVLPIVAVAVPLVDVLFGLPIMLVMVLASEGLRLSILWCVPIACVELLLVAGLAWLAAAVSVLFRDVPNLIAVLLGVLFYLTPVFYGIKSVPDRFETVLRLNPLTTIVESYRAALLGTAAPSAAAIAAVAVGSAAVAAGGFAVFRRLEPGLADHL